MARINLLPWRAERRKQDEKGQDQGFQRRPAVVCAWATVARAGAHFQPGRADFRRRGFSAKEGVDRRRGAA